MADKKPPSLYDIIERVLAQVPGPIPIDELAKRVLAIYPSKAKNPLTSVRSTLRLEHAGKTLVFLDRQTIVPLRVAMQGVRIPYSPDPRGSRPRGALYRSGLRLLPTPGPSTPGYAPAGCCRQPVG